MRAKAKQVKEEVVAARQQLAQTARAERLQLRQQYEQVQEHVGSTAKGMHDSMYARKFVSAEAAARLKQSGRRVW